MRLDDPRLAELAARDARPVGGRLVRRGVGRPPAVHRGRAARGRRDPARPPQAVPADLRPVRRAALLRRGRRAAGVAVAARGRASGIAVCEDFWHLAVPQLLALDGAQILINVSSSPGPRPRARPTRWAWARRRSWRTLMRTYAQLTTSFVVFCNRVGVDESISFWGGSEVIGPTGDQRLFSAPLYEEGLFTVDIDLGRRPPRADRAAAAARRAAGAAGPRAGADRRRAGGPGRRLDGRGRAPRPARRRARATRPGRSARTGAADARRARRGRRTPTEDAADRAPTALFELPAELAIDTDVARRVIGEFIRGQLARPASSGPCSACRAASTRRSSRTSSPRRSAPTGCCAC